MSDMPCGMTLVSTKPGVTVGEALDVSGLRTYAFGHSSPMWWGTGGLIITETTVFALCVMTYFYLRTLSTAWPMESLPPELTWGTLNAIIMLASAWPNHWTKHAAETEDLPKIRLGLVICVGFAIVLLLVRILEFQTLNVRWDRNAYGSVVWMLMVLHTIHLITDTYDTVVLAVLMHTDKIEGKRFSDVSENALYWYFVVLSWVPVYAVIYWGARL